MRRRGLKPLHACCLPAAAAGCQPAAPQRRGVQRNRAEPTARRCSLDLAFAIITPMKHDRAEVARQQGAGRCVLPACRCRWMPASSTTAARRAAQPRRADGPALLLGSRVRNHHADEARPGRGGEATGRGLLRAACLPLPLDASQQHQRRGVQRNRAEPTARRGSLGNKRYLKLQSDAAAKAAAWDRDDAARAMAVEDGPSIEL